MVLMGDLYQTLGKPAGVPKMPFIALGYAVLAVIMAVLFSKMRQEKAYVTQGLMFGAVCGLLFSLPLSLIMVGIQDWSKKLVLIDAAWNIVNMGVGGLAIAYVYNKVKE